MRMKRSRQVFTARGEFHRRHAFGDGVAGVGAQDVTADNAIRLRVGDDLYEAFSLLEILRLG